MGTSPTGGLRKPPRSRKPTTAADLVEPGRNRRGRRGFIRAEHRGRVARSSVAEPERRVAIPAGRPGRATKVSSTRARGLSIPRPAATMGNQPGGGSRRRPCPPRRAGPHETSPISDCGQGPISLERATLRRGCTRLPSRILKVGAKPRVNRPQGRRSNAAVTRMPLGQPRATQRGRTGQTQGQRTSPSGMRQAQGPGQAQGKDKPKGKDKEK